MTFIDVGGNIIMRLALPPESCKVYTPSALADAMVAALGDEAHFQWLEPSHGKGAFLEALAKRLIGKERIVAVDLDPTPSCADKLARVLRGKDFLRWATQTGQRFDRIVGNPPYVAISQLPVSLRAAAAATTDLSGRPIGKGANVWYAFVLASLKLLNPGGNLGFVLPSSAEFADYSAAIRDAIGNHFDKLELYRSVRPLFPDVQEGSLVAIARHFKRQPFRVVRRRFSTPAKLISALSRSQSLNGRQCPRGSTAGQGDMVRLGSVADIRLGGVTGDACYFLMDEDARERLGLPAAAFTPVLSRARDLRTAFIDRNAWQRLRDEGSRVWLFNPTLAATRYRNVKRYLRRRVGGCNRAGFKISNRTPWYRTPLPKNPHAFLSGMGQSGPWLCINEMPTLNATNTLYVVNFKSENRNDHFGYALGLLSSSARRQLRRKGRRYADGLIKYEPSALVELRLPPVRAGVDYRRIYIEALVAWLDGRAKRAMEMADSAFAPRSSDDRRSSRPVGD